MNKRTYCIYEGKDKVRGGRQNNNKLHEEKEKRKNNAKGNKPLKEVLYSK